MTESSTTIPLPPRYYIWLPRTMRDIDDFKNTVCKNCIHEPESCEAASEFLEEVEEHGAPCEWHSCDCEFCSAEPNMQTLSDWFNSWKKLHVQSGKIEESEHMKYKCEKFEMDPNRAPFFDPDQIKIF